MVLKLIKPWNNLPVGSPVTAEPEDAQEGAATLVGAARWAHLLAKGFIEPIRVVKGGAANG